MMSTSIVGETQLIKVTVSGTDPKQIALIANTTVDEFKLYVEELARDRAETTRSALDTQIAELEDRREEVETRTAEIAASSDAQSQANHHAVCSIARRGEHPRRPAELFHDRAELRR